MASVQIREVDDYFPFSIDLLPSGIKIPFDIYMVEENQMKPVINKGNYFTNLLKDALREKGIKTLYIHLNDRKIFNDFIYQNKPSDYFNSLLERFRINNELYFKIDKNCLTSEVLINFPIYVYDGEKLKIFINANEKEQKEVEPENIPEGDLLIKKEDIPLYYEYLNSLLNSTDKKEYVLKEHSKLLLRELYENPFNRKTLIALIDKIDKILDCLYIDKDFLLKLGDLKKHDNYSYLHSLNVMTMSAALGIKINLDRESLRNLTIAGALHDIGKTRISPLILSKLGRLNDREFEIYKTHVIESVNIVRQLDLPEIIISGIAHHHEKLNGKGYPMRLKGDEISLFGKIIAVVDAFDMMTTPKPMKYALTPFNALSILVQDRGCYDKELLATFIKMLGRMI